MLCTSIKTDRVKCVDFHPDEPWILASLYNGKVIIYDYEKNETRNLFEPVTVPIRCCKFIARKQWFVIGSDDMKIRVYNYNTLDQVACFIAHQDFIRALDVHETKPYIITCSDDMVIKLWDWDHNFNLVRTYEGHNYFIMSVKFNPKDPNSFATASLDRTIKIWTISSTTPNYSLTGHNRGLNCIDYYPGSDKPYIASGSDDHTIKIWDYQTKTCVYTLEGHNDNVTCVCYHPRLPLIISVGEDEKVILWNTQTYKLDSTISNVMNRGWSVTGNPGSGKIALGFDDGFSIYQIGVETPTISMDSQGKIVWSVQNDIFISNLAAIPIMEGESEREHNGEIISLNTKDLGRCEITPMIISHSPNSRFISVYGENEYYIYTSRQLRNKGYGKCLFFTWGIDNGSYAILETQNTLHIFSNFNPSHTITIPEGVVNLYGGPCLSVIYNQFIIFYSWSTGKIIRKIDVSANYICWSSDNELVAIFTSDSLYVLSFRKEVVDNHEYTQEEETSGIYNAFEVISENTLTAQRGEWYNHALLFVSENKLKYMIGSYIETISYVGNRSYFLKYIPKDKKVYFTDNHYNITSYTIDSSVLDYQTDICEENIEHANYLLTQISKEKYDVLAKFLNNRGYVEEALHLAIDPELKFEYCIELKKVDEAYSLLLHEPSLNDKIYIYQRWKRLSDVCIELGNLHLAVECSTRAHDLSALLLLLSSLGDKEGLKKLSQRSEDTKFYNISFIASYIISDIDNCISILLNTQRYAEAAFFARTYIPSRISEIVDLWKKDLLKRKNPASSLLADPRDFMDLFPQVLEASQIEKNILILYKNFIPANKYIDYNTFKNSEEGMSIQGMLSLIQTDLKSNSVSDDNNKEKSQEIEENTNNYFDDNIMVNTNEKEDEEKTEITVDIHQIIEEEKERQKEKEQNIITHNNNNDNNNIYESISTEVEDEITADNLEDVLNDIEMNNDEDIVSNNNNNISNNTNNNTNNSDTFSDISGEISDGDLDDLEKELANM
ncbi:hypothetical protein WA158_002836 [Blastocystis sp. Blastoise]